MRLESRTKQSSGKVGPFKHLDRLDGIAFCQYKAERLTAVSRLPSSLLSWAWGQAMMDGYTCGVETIVTW
jgi:hypothetical protein